MESLHIHEATFDTSTGNVKIIHLQGKVVLPEWIYAEDEEGIMLTVNQGVFWPITVCGREGLVEGKITKRLKWKNSCSARRRESSGILLLASPLEQEPSKSSTRPRYDVHARLQTSKHLDPESLWTKSGVLWAKVLPPLFCTIPVRVRP